MSTAALPLSPSHLSKKAPWWEIILIMALSLGTGLVFPALKIVSILLPVAYLLLERSLRHRTWGEVGFNVRSIPSGLIKNILWVVLVGVVTQALAAFGSYYFFHEYARHIVARLPFDMNSIDGKLIVMLGISVLGEEIIYRSLFQGRLAAFLPPAAAILISSLVFALMHYAPGPANIVFIDLMSVFIDSLIYGVIFQRTHNVFVSWIAHFLADIVGLMFLLMIK